jgi:hypothetical protein
LTRNAKQQEEDSTLRIDAIPTTPTYSTAITVAPITPPTGPPCHQYVIHDGLKLEPSPPHDPHGTSNPWTQQQGSQFNPHCNKARQDRRTEPSLLRKTMISSARAADPMRSMPFWNGKFFELTPLVWHPPYSGPALPLGDPSLEISGIWLPFNLDSQYNSLGEDDRIVGQCLIQSQRKGCSQMYLQDQEIYEAMT